MTTDPYLESTALPTDECLILLQSVTVGHLALSILNLPEIYPVNYVVRDGNILFRTAPGSKLLELTINPHVAFQVDSYSKGEAWSVIVKGDARALETEAEILDAESAPPWPFQSNYKPVFVQITPSEITGITFGIDQSTPREDPLREPPQE